ncbi:MAG: Glu/Leu/Phe/Val dehydrogenase dimerization domain-containing protein [Pseudomonadota bacterium]
MTIWASSTEDFLNTLRDAGLRRACLILDPSSNELVPSHPCLDGLAARISGGMRDFRQHEAIFFEVGHDSGHLLAAFVHATKRGLAAGGTRFWGYDTLEDMVRDGLRLSRGMGQKNSLAGLWWGGGKGVIARQAGKDHRDPLLRKAIYNDYGRFVSGLCGVYVTAEDVGTTPQDMANVFQTTRFTTCIPPEFGGSGNPSAITAAGVVCAMEAALHSSDQGTLAGKTIAMQGLGNVAFYMIEELLGRGIAKVVAVDIDQDSVDRALRTYADGRLTATVVDKRDTSILAQECDVLAPNAVGGILNPDTIPHIKAPVVCGAANNQFEDSQRDATLLQERGILGVPDFLANRMGIVNCANEQYGVFEGDPMVEAHLDRETPTGVFQRCLEVFSRAQASGRTPNAEAEALADELSQQNHPIWGHRGPQIIDYLVTSRWADQV